MNKILIIGVGGGGRNAVQRMKEIGIPDANYITFSCFRPTQLTHKGTIFSI